MIGGADAGRPRSMAGGRSARYDERRESRGTAGSYAPGWSDAAAALTLECLHSSCKEAGMADNIVQYCTQLLQSSTNVTRFAKSNGMKGGSAADRELATKATAHRE